MDYTIVIGLDKAHLSQLQLVLPSWKKHKPSLFDNNFSIFHDDSVDGDELDEFLYNNFDAACTINKWPPEGVTYEGDPNDKWKNPQRAKMLSGFVHIAAQSVSTAYWLKVDTDVVATGNDDWVEDSWFENEPAIIAQKWGYTKPPMQMMELDNWANAHLDKLPNWIWQHPPLNLIPNPGSSLVKHERIAGWCGFYNTEFTKLCSEAAESIEGSGQLPVPSQDGFLFYMAKRGNFNIIRTNFKSRGWKLRSSMKAIKQAVEEAMI